MIRNILDKTPAMTASLETLKCVCSTSDRDFVERNIDQVLTGVMFGVSQDTEEVVLTGLQALLECLDCTAGNFARLEERNYLMSVVCNLTQSSSDQVSSLALECLTRIVTLYYPLMEEYMTVALVPITLQAIQSQQDRTVMQAIEFWSNICDCELSLTDDWLRELVGDWSLTLVDSLHRVIREVDSSNLDMEQWTQVTAATNCLSLLGQCLGSTVTNRSLTFISQNIHSSHWRERHAALLCLSTLLEMEDRDGLVPVVASFLSMAEGFLRDDNPSIRTAASYLLLQVSDRAVDSLNSSQATSSTLGLVSLCLQSQDYRLTEHGCLVISNLIRSQSKSSPEIHCYLENNFHHLLSITEMDFLASKNNSSLRQVAFSALSDIIEKYSQQLLETLKSSVPLILNRLYKLLSPAVLVTSIDISFNCSILNSIILSLERIAVLGLAPEILPAISKMFDHQQLHEDALLLLRALVDQLGSDMAAWIGNIVNVVSHYTRELSDAQISQAAVGMIGDLYTKASDLMLPYTDLLVQNLLTILTSCEASLPLLAVTLATLADIVLHSNDYTRYVEHTLRVIFETNILQNKETVGPGLELLSGLVQISNSDDEHVERILGGCSERILSAVIALLESESELCDSLVRSCVGLLGDLALRQNQIFSALSEAQVGSIRQAVIRGQNSHSRRTRSLSVWAATQLLNVYNNNQESQASYLTVKKAKVTDDVFYDVKVTVTNQQFITQNIETENVTIRLNTPALVPVIQCSDVEATVKLPRQRKKRTAVSCTEEGENKKHKENY